MATSGPGKNFIKIFDKENIFAKIKNEVRPHIGVFQWLE